MKPPILSAAAVARIVKQRNRAFNGASKAHKRVLVAKDVIAQVKAGRIKPRRSTWVTPIHNFGFTVPFPVGIGEGLRERVLCGFTSCNACALGAVLTSLTLFKNRVDECNADITLAFSGIHEGNERDTTGIKKLFPADQLQLIELAFEKGRGYFHKLTPGDNSDDINCIVRLSIKHKQAIAFGERYPNTTKRLLAIMRNIIKHRGSFVP